MSTTSRRVDAFDVRTTHALRFAADARVLSAELLVLLVAAVAFRQPISQAIGTAGGPLPTASTPVPALAAVEPYYDFPLANGYVAPETFERAADPATADAMPLPVTLPSLAKGVQAGTSIARSTTTTYRVRTGDSLWLVAKRQLGRNADVASIGRLTRTIYVANKPTIGPDPSQISVGVSLALG